MILEGQAGPGAACVRAGQAAAVPTGEMESTMSRDSVTSRLSALALAFALVLGADYAVRGQATSKTPDTAKVKSKADAKAKVLLDLNKASAEELADTLPGVGPATAKKIVDGRPYTTVDDLAKAGVSAKVIDGIRPLVTVGAAPPAEKAKGKTPKTGTTAKPAPGKLVNLNTAPKEELDALPGIGPVKAQAIIDARPFKTIEDVMKVKGIKQGEFSKIKDLITVQ
jgi:competence protein ComEA